MVRTTYPSWTSLNWLTEYQQVRNEIAVLKRVSVGHRNILTLVDYFETMNNGIELSRLHGQVYDLT